MADEAFRVFPSSTIPVEPISQPSISDAVGLSTSLLWTLLLGTFGLTWVVLVTLICEKCRNSDWPLGFWLSFLVATIITTAANFSVKIINLPTLYEKRRLDAEDREKKRVEDEAQYLTQSLRGLHEKSLNLLKEILEHRDKASSWLQSAEREYADSAFAPYWEAIEQATIQFAKYGQKIDDLSRIAGQYYGTLAGRNHTFPIFPVRLNSLPNVEKTLAEFYRVNRLGQTKYEFAQIWEHYKDRKVMLGNFEFLGVAIKNLEYAIEAALAGLESSISTTQAQEIEGEIRTRAMLVSTEPK